MPGSLDAILHVLHLIGPYDAVVLTIEPESQSPGDVKTQIAGPHPRVSDGSGASLGSLKVQGDAEAASSGTTV